jgi:hypothetical protein
MWIARLYVLGLAILLVGVFAGYGALLPKVSCLRQGVV